MALKVKFAGFRKKELNTTYDEKADEEVQGRNTFWDPSDTFFIYWQKSMSRWAICDSASLKAAQQGLAPGWAYRTDAAHFTRSRGWMEIYGAGDWKRANVSCKVLDGKVRDDGHTMNAVKSELSEEDVAGNFTSSASGGDDDDAGGDSTETPSLTAQAYAILVQNIYMLHNPKKVRDIGALLQKYRHREQVLYDEVCRTYGENPMRFYPQHAEQLARVSVKSEN